MDDTFFKYVQSSNGIVITACKKRCKIIEIPSEINGLKVTQIGDGFVQGKKSITEVIIPEGVVLIGKSAFEDCISLSKVVLPSSLETIESRAFFGCTSLESVVLPNVKLVCSEAFRRCYNLKEVTLSDNMQEFKFWAFDECPIEKVKFSEQFCNRPNVEEFFEIMREVGLYSYETVLEKPTL